MAEVHLWQHQASVTNNIALNYAPAEIPSGVLGIVNLTRLWQTGPYEHQKGPVTNAIVSLLKSSGTLSGCTTDSALVSATLKNYSWNVVSPLCMKQPASGVRNFDLPMRVNVKNDKGA